MRVQRILWLALLWLLCTAPASAQEASARITAPLPGQVVQGQVAIMGTSDMPNFSSAEVAFAYDPNLLGTWFLVQTSGQPIAEGLLATWDTTSITDGDYVLRLRVFLLDGTFREATVAVRVRNYTPLPSPMPSPTATPARLAIPTPMLLPAAPTLTATARPVFPTPTPLPPNPAALTPPRIYAGFRRGALVTAALFVAFLLILRRRRSYRE